MVTAIAKKIEICAMDEEDFHLRDSCIEVEWFRWKLKRQIPDRHKVSKASRGGMIW